MNNLTIIILLVILVIIYNMHKTEGFESSIQPIKCMDGAKVSGKSCNIPRCANYDNVQKKCYDKVNYRDWVCPEGYTKSGSNCQKSACPTGQSVSFEKTKSYCCPTGKVASEDATGSVICCGTNMYNNLGSCECKTNYSNKITGSDGYTMCCKTGEVRAKDKDDKLTNTCCPSANPYYRKHQGNMKCMSTKS